MHTLPGPSLGPISFPGNPPSGGGKLFTLHLFSIIQILNYVHFSKRLLRDFPGGPMVKNPPFNAGDVGSIPGQGTKIPHATGQL